MTSSIEKAIEKLQQGQNNARNQLSKNTRTKRAKTGNIHESLHVQSEKALRLNLVELGNQGFLTPDTLHSKRAEEYRILKRPLLMNAFGKTAADVDNGNLIMVTSALPGEGKTFTTINLAMSMAIEMDTTVLVVDSDVIKPSLTRTLELENRPGLIDILSDDSLELCSMIVKTDMPKLRVLPAGRPHLHSTELLASSHMRRLANELSERYANRVVLFDAPPLLATSQASVLARVVGQILVVVQSGKTSQSAIKAAVSQIDENKVIGMVLNQSHPSFNQEYYGGYYGSYGK